MAKTRRPILELNCDEARRFFLKHESYCSFDLPPYFNFSELLRQVSEFLDGKEPKSVSKSKPADCENVNFTLMANKDGKYAWRPLQLCHPVLYVAMVHLITEEGNWEELKKRFSTFAQSSVISCLSIPVESQSDESDKAEQIGKWWAEVEQRSIELALDFDVIAHADVANCYPSLYTHSIAWAVHSKSVAKQERKNTKLLGNRLDSLVQDMQNGQTNGIPQGPVLMDFVAELVLGYADVLISSELGEAKSEETLVLRYRDDYRVFAKNTQVAESVLKVISEVLSQLGMKLNTSKTKFGTDVISGSVKHEKRVWLAGPPIPSSLEKHLLLIHSHGNAYPNSPVLPVALDKFYRRLLNSSGDRVRVFALPLISIVVDIAYRNPRVYPVSMAIVSGLVGFLGDAQKKSEVVSRILRKFRTIPNTGYLEVWLQRIAVANDLPISFGEQLCKKVQDPSVHLWENSWIGAKKLLKILETCPVVDDGKLKAIPAVVPIKEIELFESPY